MKNLRVHSFSPPPRKINSFSSPKLTGQISEYLPLDAKKKKRRETNYYVKVWKIGKEKRFSTSEASEFAAFGLLKKSVCMYMYFVRCIENF